VSVTAWVLPLSPALSPSVVVIIVVAAAPGVAVIPGLFVAALDLVKQFLQALVLLGRLARRGFLDALFFGRAVVALLLIGRRRRGRCDEGLPGRN